MQEVFSGMQEVFSGIQAQYSWWVQINLVHVMFYHLRTACVPSFDCFCFRNVTSKRSNTSNHWFIVVLWKLKKLHSSEMALQFLKHPVTISRGLHNETTLTFISRLRNPKLLFSGNLSKLLLLLLFLWV